jgi:hypothetical protein
LGVNPVIFVRPATGVPVVNGVTIANLTVEGTTEGSSTSPTETVKLQKVQGFAVTDLIVRGVTAFTGIDTSASSGYIKRSYVTGALACGICVSAGTTASPATVNVLNNRSVQNTGGGLLLQGTSFPLREVSESLQAQVNNNDLSQNDTAPLGFGVRIFALGQVVPTPQVAGKATVSLNGNRLANNRYALVVDAGFPRRNTLPLSSGICDARTFTGQLSVSLNDNTIGPSSVTPALVSFTRSQVFQAPSGNPISAWQYLHNASISIADPALTLGGTAGFRIDHQEIDQFVGGNCANDVIAEPLGNRLTYNGIEVLAPFRNF